MTTSPLTQKRLIQVYLDKNRPEKEVHSPIVGVEMYDGAESMTRKHASYKNMQLY